jgi:V8-like Glu-specific endopeptidase
MLKIALALSVVSFSVSAQEFTPKVIYGLDDRLDVYQVSDPAILELSRSTAAMIATEDLPASSARRRWFRPRAKTGVVISGPSLESRGICASERFSQQPSAANCSGFLVSENLIVTAGHCVREESDCKNYKWVFDYKVSSPESSSVALSQNNIYGCKKIVETVLDPITKNDYAVIELDRSVRDRNPLALRKEGTVGVGDSLIVMGHPSGLPTKIAAGANVRSLQGTFFVGNLDTYGGNSGSAVFNAQTLEVEGVLVRGETDYVAGPDGCRVSYIIDNDQGRGEDVTYITNIKSLKSLR